MKLNMTTKRVLPLLTAAVLMAGLLQGCGSKQADTNAAAASADAGKAADAPKADASAPGKDASAPDKDGAAADGKGAPPARGDGQGGRMNLKDMLVKNGAAEAEATELEQLIQTNHIQFKWVADQLKTRKAAEVIADIKAGKAPKREAGRGGGGGRRGDGQNGGATSDGAKQDPSSGGTNDAGGGPAAAPAQG